MRQSYEALTSYVTLNNMEKNGESQLYKQGDEQATSPYGSRKKEDTRHNKKA